MRLTERQRHIAIASVERYIADMRKACEEDQGVPEGKPGTVGYNMQVVLKETLNALKGNDRVQVEKIKEMKNAGYSEAEIADALGISASEFRVLNHEGRS